MTMRKINDPSHGEKIGVSSPQAVFSSHSYLFISVRISHIDTETRGHRSCSSIAQNTESSQFSFGQAPLCPEMTLIRCAPNLTSYTKCPFKSKHFATHFCQ